VDIDEALPHFEGAVPHLWSKFNPKGKGVGAFATQAKFKDGIDPMFVNVHFLKDALKDVGLDKMLTRLISGMDIPGLDVVKATQKKVAEIETPEHVDWYVFLRFFKEKSSKNWEYRALPHFKVDIWGEVQLEIEVSEADRSSRIARKVISFGQVEGRTGPALKRSLAVIVRKAQQKILGLLSRILMKRIQSKKSKK
jgi:hypothetical protein